VLLTFWEVTALEARNEDKELNTIQARFLAISGGMIGLILCLMDSVSRATRRSQERVNSGSLPIILKRRKRSVLLT
jgi:hypothetical protein